jgi:phage protein
MNMFSLSKESEQELAHGVLDLVENYLGARDTIKPRLTGLISAQVAMEELDIKYKTLQKWENAGLRRYQPPLEDTRKVYYKVSDILNFLGVENGNLRG